MATMFPIHIYMDVCDFFPTAHKNKIQNVILEITGKT